MTSSLHCATSKKIVCQLPAGLKEDRQLSELLSFALFLASVLIYAWKAGRNTWWFAATLTVLGLFVVLNITLYASDYFTGDGINDAVLYTLTNSLTGAGIGKYILPGVGIVLALTAVFVSLGWILRRRRHHPHHFGYSLLALLLALGSVDAVRHFGRLRNWLSRRLAMAIPILLFTTKNRQKRSRLRN